MSLTSYRAAPPRANVGDRPFGPIATCDRPGGLAPTATRRPLEGGRRVGDCPSRAQSRVHVKRLVLGWPGNDLLSRVLRHSTIGAEAFNGRVRDGIGFRRLAQVTGPAKDKGSGRGPRQHLCAARDCGFRLDDQRAVAGWHNSPTSSAPGAQLRKAERPPALMRRLAGTTCRPFCQQKVFSRTLIMRDDQADRAISTGQLNASPRLHIQPINVVVFHGPDREFSFRGGFPA